jgi:hypothetical protein
MVGFIAILLVLVTVSYVAYKNKYKANILLAEQKEKNESKELLEQRSRDITIALITPAEFGKPYCKPRNNLTNFLMIPSHFFYPKSW